MATLLRWLRQQGAWIRSPHYELPALQDPGVRPELRPWCALAGGLALILSRQPAAELQSGYRLANAVFDRVRRCLEADEEPRISRKLLLELAEEIDAVADPLTKASCRACMRGRRSGGTSTGSTSLQSSETTRGGGTFAGPAEDFDDYVTQLSPDVFSQRSEELRRTVAGARREGKG